MSLKDIKGKIKSVQRTQKVTKAMEAVSAVKMKKSQERAVSGRPYAESALSILRNLAPTLTALHHSLTEKRTVNKTALIIITSDKGLCGILNSAVIKKAEKVIETLSLTKENVSLFTFGRKATEYFTRRGYPIAQHFQNISDDIVVSDLFTLTETLISSFERKEYDAVSVIYTEFRSTFEQRTAHINVLPLTISSLESVVGGIPHKGEMKKTPPSYIIEPNAESVLNTLIPKIVSTLLFHSLLESKASEHSARMVAMKNASDKSRELSKTLTRQFNKARQAAITAEVSEIVGGIEAMASG